VRRVFADNRKIREEIRIMGSRQIILTFLFRDNDVNRVKN
jgi:hypothetical protein